MDVPAPDLRVLDDAEAVSRALADELLDALPRDAAGPPYALCLAGGRTPLRAYELLAGSASRVAWSRIHLFWGDERCVPPEDPASNFGAARRALVDRVGIPAENVHRIRGEDDLDAAARAYERELSAFFAARHHAAPAFDLVLLGIGADGHTASLFPGGPELDERLRWAVPSVAPAEPRRRVTLTFRVLAASRRLVFAVVGAEKRSALERLLHADEALPCGRAAAATPTTVLADRAAAGK